MTDLDYMETQARTLFLFTPCGRLLYTNESHHPPAPRFFMGRTAEGNLWYFRHDLPEELVQQLDQLCRAEPISTDFTQPPKNYAAIRALLSSHSPIGSEWRGPAYVFPAQLQ